MDAMSSIFHNIQKNMVYHPLPLVLVYIATKDPTLNSYNFIILCSIIYILHNPISVTLFTQKLTSVRINFDGNILAIK